MDPVEFNRHKSLEHTQTQQIYQEAEESLHNLENMLVAQPTYFENFNVEESNGIQVVLA